MKNGGIIMTKKKMVNKIVMKNIKSLTKEQEQLQWQKTVIKEEHVKSQ